MTLYILFSNISTICFDLFRDTRSVFLASIATPDIQLSVLLIVLGDKWYDYNWQYLIKWTIFVSTEITYFTYSFRRSVALFVLRKIKSSGLYAKHHFRIWGNHVLVNHIFSFPSNLNTRCISNNQLSIGMTCRMRDTSSSNLAQCSISTPPENVRKLKLF